MPFPVDNIRAVCKERGTNLAEVERALKIGNGVIAKWGKNKSYPPYDRIVEIANFLNVPISRLTGETDEKTPAPTGGDGLSEREWALIRAFRAAPEGYQDSALSLLESAPPPPQAPGGAGEGK